MKPVPRGYSIIKYSCQVMAHGGRFYVTDCQPWTIKDNCVREDCPMRNLALPLEDNGAVARLACDPPGELADFLLSVQRTAPVEGG